MIPRSAAFDRLPVCFTLSSMRTANNAGADPLPRAPFRFKRRRFLTWLECTPYLSATSAIDAPAFIDASAIARFSSTDRIRRRRFGSDPFTF
jgi:hypothetical protein